MELNDVVNLSFKMVDQVTSSMNLYLIVVAALVGWLSSSKNRPPRKLKIIFTVALILFFLLNIRSLVIGHLVYNAVASELQAMINPITFDTNELYEIMSNLAVGRYKQWVFLFLHLAIDVLFLVAIWIK